MTKYFRLHIITLVAVIVILSLALGFFIFYRTSFFIPLSLTVAIATCVIYLISYLEKSTRELTHFLLSLKQGAFTENFSLRNKGNLFMQLNSAMNDIVKEFAQVAHDKELHYQLLETLNENVGVGIIIFDKSGNLKSINRAGKNLLDTRILKSIDDLQKIDANLYHTVRSLKPEQKVLTKVFIREHQYQLSTQVKELKLGTERLKIVFIQNLNNELDEKEIEAWHQLVSVLTHEIMNSVTPIASLTNAMIKILKNDHNTPKTFSELTADESEDLHNSISTIHSRAVGLMNFVSAYKEFSGSIPFNPMLTNVSELLLDVVRLFTPEFRARNITANVNVEASVISIADRPLVEQVLINLLKNAMEAVNQNGTGKVTITLHQNPDNLISISIADNGSGIDKEIQSKIFVPFFTTKRKGSGIGLSLSKKIMKLHQGTISFKSSKESGTEFTIEWKSV